MRIICIHNINKLYTVKKDVYLDILNIKKAIFTTTLFQLHYTTYLLIIQYDHAGALGIELYSILLLFLKDVEAFVLSNTNLTMREGYDFFRTCLNIKYK